MTPAQRAKLREKAKANWAARSTEQRAAHYAASKRGLAKHYAKHKIAVPAWAEKWRDIYLEIASEEDEFAAAKYVRALKREGR